MVVNNLYLEQPFFVFRFVENGVGRLQIYNLLYQSINSKE